MNQNIIDHVAIPNEKVDISSSQILSIRAFLTNFNFRTLRNWYNFIDKNEDIEICISKDGIVSITLRVYTEYTEKAIALLDKISKKVCSIISDKYFLSEISILEKRKIDLKDFINKEININEFRSMNIKIAPEIKMRISKCGEKHIISFRDYKDVNKVLHIYSLILNGKKLRDLDPEEVNVTITKSLFYSIL